MSLIAVLSVAGCGGSSGAGSATSGRPATAGAAATGARGSSTTAAPGASTTAERVAPTSASSATTRTAGASGVRLPATFTIHLGGAVTPPNVTAPSSVTIVLSVICVDRRGHAVTIHTPAPHSLRVPAHGSASVTLAGLPPGRYRLSVDGAPRATLVVGGQPGP